MSTPCCNCGCQVANETEHTAAPACDACRAMWAQKEIDRARRLLEAHGYTVTKGVQ